MRLPILCLALVSLAAASAAGQDALPPELKESLRRFRETLRQEAAAPSAQNAADALTPETLLIRDSDTFIPPESITALQAAADLASLDYALRKGYVGANFVDRGIFDAALSGIAKLKPAGTVSPTELCERLADVLWTIPDRHLGVGIVGRMDAGTAARVAKEEVARVGRNSARPGRTPWDVTTVAVAGKTVSVISIPEFPPAKDAAWNGFIETARAALAGAPAVIIDVRGNSGGDNEKGLELIGILYGQEPPAILKKRVYSQTPETMALIANNYKLKMKRLKDKGEEVPDFYRKALSDALSKLDSAKRGGLPAQRTDEFKARPALDASRLFAGRIHILADRATGSSGETMVQSLLEHPRATFVGENTAGALNFGNVGYLVLQHSQIYIALASDYWLHANGRQDWEKTGIPPKLRVASGKDAIEASKELLARELQ